MPQVHPTIGDIEVDLVLDGENGVKLAIEVDGKEFHEDRQQQDKARDAFLKAQGYEVLRTPARAVMETPFEVLHSIKEHVAR
jgi:very-short-patch-repair endonuclease